MDDYKHNETKTGNDKTDYQTIENAAHVTGLSKGRIYQLATSGTVKALPPRPILVDLVSLKEYASTARRGRPSKRG